MSFEGSTSTFALIAFSSFLTLLISHLAVRQSSPQIIQAPFSTLQSAQPPSIPPTPAAPSPPPPPPPPPSQAALPPPQHTHIITSPPPQALTTELSGSINLLILVLLVLLFGIGGLWLECLHFRGGLGSKSKGSRCKTKKKGYVSTSSDDEGEIESSCQDQEARSLPGGWHEEKCSSSSTWRDQMKRKVGERMKEAVGGTTPTSSSRIKRSVCKASEHAGQQDSACCACPPLPSSSSSSSSMSMSGNGKQTVQQQPSGGTTSSMKSTSGNHSEKAEEEKVAVDEAWKEQLLLRVAKLEDQTKPSVASVSVSSAKKEKTEAVTTKMSAKAEVPGEEGATAGSKESTTTKSQGVKQGNAKVPKDKIEVLYAEPPMAMAEVPAARVDPDLDVPLLGGISAGDATQKEVKNTQPSQVDDQSKVSKKGKGKQKEEVASKGDKAATPSPEESKDSTRSSEVQKSGPPGKWQDELPESGKNQGKIAKGLQKLANVTKDIRDEVINHVLIELEDGSDARVRRADYQDMSNATASDDDGQGEAEEKKGGRTKTVSGKNTQQESPKAKSNDTTTKAANAGKNSEKEGITKVADAKTAGKKKSNGKSEVGGGEGTAVSEGVAAGTKGEEEATKATSVEEKKSVKAKTVGSTSKEPLGDAQAQQSDKDGAALYYQTADYLSGQYSGLVSHKTKQVNEFLDKQFAAASEAAGLKMNLPWYGHQVEENHGEQAQGEGGSSEAVKRALDLFHKYRQECEKNGKPGVSVSPNAVAPSSNGASDKVLQTLIDALLEAQRAEGRAATLDKTHNVAEKSKTASGCVQDDAQSTSSYPSVIPLEAVNADSLEKVGVWAKEQQQRQAHHHKVEKTTQINEALQLLSADTRKNVHYIKEDLDTLKEGATLKVRTLKGLLKKKKTTAPAPSPSEELEGCKQSSLPRKTKSVRLQDAAGHGEGPRDIAMGETEEQARYRRLRELASRLNE